MSPSDIGRRFIAFSALAMRRTLSKPAAYLATALVYAASIDNPAPSAVANSSAEIEGTGDFDMYCCMRARLARCKVLRLELMLRLLDRYGPNSMTSTIAN